MIIQSSTTGISFQHLNLLLFPTVGKNFRGNIELQWPRHQDCLGSKMSGCQARNFYKKSKNTTSVFDPIFLEVLRVATLIQDLPTQPLMVIMFTGFLVFKAGRNLIICFSKVMKLSCFLAPDKELWLCILCYWHKKNVKIGKETKVWNFKLESV